MSAPARSRARPATAGPRSRTAELDGGILSRLVRLARDNQRGFRKLFLAAARNAAAATAAPAEPPLSPPSASDMQLDGPAGHAALLRTIIAAFPDCQDTISDLQYVALQLQVGWDSPMRPPQLEKLLTDVHESDAAATAAALLQRGPVPVALADALRHISAWIAVAPGGAPGAVEEAFAACDATGGGRLTGPELLRFLSKEVPDISSTEMRIFISHLRAQGVARDGEGFALNALRKSAQWVPPPAPKEPKNPRRPVKAVAGVPPHLLLLERAAVEDAAGVSAPEPDTIGSGENRSGAATNDVHKATGGSCAEREGRDPTTREHRNSTTESGRLEADRDAFAPPESPAPSTPLHSPLHQLSLSPSPPQVARSVRSPDARSRSPRPRSPLPAGVQLLIPSSSPLRELPRPEGSLEAPSLVTDPSQRPLSRLQRRQPQRPGSASHQRPTLMRGVLAPQPEEAAGPRARRRPRSAKPAWQPAFLQAYLNQKTAQAGSAGAGKTPSRPHSAGVQSRSVWGAHATFLAASASAGGGSPQGGGRNSLIGSLPAGLELGAPAAGDAGTVERRLRGAIEELTERIAQLEAERAAAAPAAAEPAEEEARRATGAAAAAEDGENHGGGSDWPGEASKHRPLLPWDARERPRSQEGPSSADASSRFGRSGFPQRPLTAVPRSRGGAPPAPWEPVPLNARAGSPPRTPPRRAQRTEEEQEQRRRLKREQEERERKEGERLKQHWLEQINGSRSEPALLACRSGAGGAGGAGGARTTAAAPLPRVLPHAAARDTAAEREGSRRRLYPFVPSIRSASRIYTVDPRPVGPPRPPEAAHPHPNPGACATAFFRGPGANGGGDGGNGGGGVGGQLPKRPATAGAAPGRRAPPAGSWWDRERGGGGAAGGGGDGRGLLPKQRSQPSPPRLQSPPRPPIVALAAGNQVAAAQVIRETKLLQKRTIAAARASVRAAASAAASASAAAGGGAAGGRSGRPSTAPAGSPFVGDVRGGGDDGGGFRFPPAPGASVSDLFGGGAAAFSRSGAAVGGGGAGGWGRGSMSPAAPAGVDGAPSSG